nr:MAG TPA: hypothetical protein [Caudoviricetes sp.]
MLKPSFLIRRYQPTVNNRNSPKTSHNFRALRKER